MKDNITLGGITYGTTTADIVSGSVTLGESLTASELSVDTLTAEITAQTAPAVSYGDPITYTRNSTLMGKFFLKTMERIGRKKWKISAVSAVGLLDNVKHYGGLYDGQTSASDVANVIDDIIADAFDYTLTGFADVLLYGWLPIDTRRNNLRQVLFAVGANITKDANGDVVISALPDTIVDEPIPKSRTFLGGKVSYPIPASAVKVTEHAYAKSGEVKEIYKGEIMAASVTSPTGASLTGQLLEFSEPYYDLECMGANILESGTNYAVLAPTASAVLTGKAYTHSTKIVTIFPTDNVGTDYIPEVKDCTLVSLANSQNVAKRVLAYYGGYKRVEQDIIVNTERPGDRVVFYDPYGELNGGYIKNLNLKFGDLLRGSAVFETGYIPAGIGNNYTHVMVVTQSGTVTLPNTNRVRFVLVGGGSGGQGGYPGEAGKQPQVSSSTSSQTRYEMVEVNGGDGWWYGSNSVDPDPLAQSNSWAYPDKWYKVATPGYVNGRYYIGYGGTLLSKLQQEGVENADRLAAYPIDAVPRGYYYRYKSSTQCYCIVGKATLQSGGEIYAYITLTPSSYTVSSSEYWAEYDELTPGGNGGNGGAGGAGGRIYQMDAEITPGDTITVVIGTGGAGGAAASGDNAPEPGADGTATTLVYDGNTFSSANGTNSADGFINVLTGAAYAMTGDAGIAGAAGGSTEGQLNAYNGNSIGTVSGGTAGSTVNTGGGGSGGGASATTVGGNGGNGGSNKSGNGGVGAAAAAPSAATVYGMGGTGGNGGGGGGNAGGYAVGGQRTLGNAGAGGAGSAGGTGAPGALLIFYGEPDPVEANNALRDNGRLALVDDDGKEVVIGANGYRSAYSAWQIDDFIAEVSGENG